MPRGLLRTRQPHAWVDGTLDATCMHYNTEHATHLAATAASRAGPRSAARARTSDLMIIRRTYRKDIHKPVWFDMV